MDPGAADAVEGAWHSRVRDSSYVEGQLESGAGFSSAVEFSFFSVRLLNFLEPGLCPFGLYRHLKLEVGSKEQMIGSSIR